MTPSQLHTMLDEIAAQEIPATMNIRKGIELRIEKIRPLSTRPLLRISRAAIVLVALMFATVAYAFYQHITYIGDPGIETAASENLVTELGLIQTHPDADVNVTLNWAYADGNRIALDWGLDYALIHGDVEATDIQLLDVNGQPYPYLNSSYPLSGGGGPSDRGISGRRENWDARGITDSPDSLELTLVLTIETLEPISNEAGGGGEGGGGGSEEDDFAAQPTEIIPIAPYQIRFDFTVPFIPAVSGLSEPMTVEVAGIPITISNIRYTPSDTQGLMCLPVGLFGEYTLLLDETHLEYKTQFMVSEAPVSSDDKTACYDFKVVGVLADSDGTLTLLFRRLITVNPQATPERYDSLIAALEAEGFKPIFEGDYPEHGYRFEITGDPDAEALEKMYRRIGELEMEILYDSIVGPWVFTIPLK